MEGAYSIVAEYGPGKQVPIKVAEQTEKEAQREANIAKKEEERRMQEARRRRSSVSGPPAGRKASVGAPARSEDLDRQRAEEVQVRKERRRASITSTEEVRAKKQVEIDAQKKDQMTAKYARSEIMTLFELFSEYDADGGGFISVTELKGHFHKLAESKTHYDGKKKSFADRRAARAHIDMAALVEPMFEAIDGDADGTVTFFELLKVIYPKANGQDFAVFKEWVYPPKPYVAPIEYVLSAEQRRELKEMFKVIDKDRSGELTIEELKRMFVGSAITGETGIDMDDLQMYFDEADFDNNASINLREFERLMISTGLYVTETHPDAEEAKY